MGIKYQWMFASKIDLSEFLMQFQCINPSSPKHEQRDIIGLIDVRQQLQVGYYWTMLMINNFMIQSHIITLEQNTGRSYNITDMNSHNKILLLLLSTVVLLVNSAVVVNQLAGISDQNLVYSGTIPISDTNNLFFTYYGVDNQKDQAALKNYPLLVVVGSPGSSAQYLSLSALGPLKLNNDMTLTVNPNKLTQWASVMFLDLLGSGFSFAASPNDIPTDAKTFGIQVTTAINTLIKESPLGASQTIILAGEGTFIRSVAGIDDIGIDTLKGVIHISPWPELYAIGKYYGGAGVDLKIYGSSEQIAIDSTFTNCYTYIRNAKFLQAHQCLDTILNFVESKTKNVNLFDVALGSNLTQTLPMIQYYFSQTDTVTKFKAPTARLFQTQSGYLSNKTYVDLSKNYTKDLSQFMKDFFNVKHWFISGEHDYISYKKAVRNWLENELAFVESNDFRAKKLQDIVIDGVTVGYTKGVKQVTYSQILKAGHYTFNDQTKVLSTIFKQWLDTIVPATPRQITIADE